MTPFNLVAQSYLEIVGPCMNRGGYSAADSERLFPEFHNIEEGNNMRTSKLIFVCICLVGLSQLLWSQNNGMATHQHGIPGYLDPHSKTFTTKAENSRVGHQRDTPLAGTAIVFRETFNFSISAQDIPAAAVIFCYAEISTSDTNGDFYDSNSIVATRSGESASCSVPILVKWTLVNPGTDTIDARVEAYSEQGISLGGGAWDYAERYSEVPELTLSVPANDQTVTTSVFFTM